jgi:outer membrane murein-binding lipoprotein Lpp
MKPLTFLMLLAAILICPLLMGCKSGVQTSSQSSADVKIDLNSKVPIGYEICADRMSNSRAPISI